jgi:tetraacyldisaccharide 4'-kinase
MLARQLPGVAVLVSHDRHLAGALAEARLGCTVHLLDDGFQHVRLVRDVDLLLVRKGELENGRVLPAGVLREPAEAAGAADAWVCDKGELTEMTAAGERAGVTRVFTAARMLEPPVAETPAAREALQARSPLLLVSGIADPERFEADVRAAGWTVAAHVAFADHHRYAARDVTAVVARAREVGASLVGTTEKDAVRLASLAPLPFELAVFPLQVRVEPLHDFRSWLLWELVTARARG